MRIQPIVATLMVLGLTVAPTPARAAAAAVSPRATRTLAVIPFYSPERMWQLYTPTASNNGWNLR